MLSIVFKVILSSSITIVKGILSVFLPNITIASILNDANFCDIVPAKFEI